jgi:arabinose-5-phosphate isomerase
VDAREQILTATARVLQKEAEAIALTAGRLDDSWVQAVELMYRCRGKVVVFGLGKTGHVGRKIAASLASLGTPAFFLHAAEAAHGDLGMLDRNDVVLAISYSGETAEVVARLGYIRDLGVPLIALTKTASSSLGRAATVVLELPVEGEADHLNLAPTCSSTVALAAGDALAVAVAELRQLTREDFGLRHPGGALGKAVNGPAGR